MRAGSLRQEGRSVLDVLALMLQVLNNGTILFTVFLLLYTFLRDTISIILINLSKKSIFFFANKKFI